MDIGHQFNDFIDWFNMVQWIPQYEIPINKKHIPIPFPLHCFLCNCLFIFTVRAKAHYCALCGQEAIK